MKHIFLKLEHMFMVISLVFGFIFVFLTPPMSTPDERAHFLNSIRYSNFDFYPDYKNGVYGFYIENDKVEFSDYYTIQNQSANKLEWNVSFSEYYFNSWLPKQSNLNIFYDNRLILLNSTGYLISGFGMILFNFISKIVFGANYTNPFNLLLVGRLSNLLFYIFLIYSSIKNTDKYKLTLFTLGLLPMSMYLGSSISYDSILIPISFYIFVSLMNSFFDDRKNFINDKKEYLKFLLAIFFITGIKYIYIALLLPIAVFGFTKNRFNLKKHVGIFLTIIAAYLLFNFSYLKGLTQTATSFYSVNQIDYVLSHPIEYIHIFINSIVSLREFYITSFLGKLGQLDLNLPVPIYLILILLIFVANIIDQFNDIDEKRKITSLTKIVFFLSGFLAIQLVFLGMYIYWTPLPGIGEVGQDTISGVQGRYFIPIFMYFIPLFSVLLEKLKPKSVVQNTTYFAQITIIVFIIICLLITIFMLIIRYYM